MIPAYRLNRLIRDLRALIPQLPGVYTRHHAREVLKVLEVLGPTPALTLPPEAGDAVGDEVTP